MKITLKRLGLGLAALAVALVPLAAMASFSPDRPTKVYDPTAPGFDRPTFNSYTGTPFYGDERYFFDGKDAANTQNGGFQDIIQAKPGQELTLRTYIHNGADPSLNAGGTGIAHNTRVRIDLPTDNAKQLRAASYITADNATGVSDTVDFQNPNTAFNLSYVPGSAMLYNAHFTNGVALAQDPTTGAGALIGSDALDGNFKACFEFQSFVYIKVRVNGPSINLEKKITTPVSTDYKDTLTGNPGDTVSWILHFKTGNTAVNALTVRDQLPAHLELVPGTVLLVTPNSPNGVALDDNFLFAGGVNTGNFGPNSDGYIRYRTKIKNDLASNECNPQAVNVAFARAESVPEVNATANLNITHACTTTVTQTPPPTTTTPAAPALPQTGAEGALAGMFGTAGIGYSLRAYLRSKQSLIRSLRR